ncbi:MAG: hypothetical protein E7001_02545 [Coriobacteriaceae bacterium]|nr:hypothetical protein [Coriobacteriaceae bacterium]
MPRPADVDRVAVGDRGRVAYTESTPDEGRGTCAAFMGRCLRFFEGMGVRVERVATDGGPRGAAAAGSTRRRGTRASATCTRGRSALGGTARSSA